MQLSLLLAPCLLLIAGKASSYNFSERSDTTPLEWWQEEVVYQIYPRSHQDSDGNGVGDLAGIEQRLDYFVELGVGSVWISPIYKSPMVDFGYDISNFTDIDPTFGTMESFRNLSKAMKARGIKLIMDFVPNHSSDQHEWFQKSIKKEDPYTDYYVWKDALGDNGDGTKTPPNNWLSVFGGSAWEWNEEREQFYLHQFTKEQPDLNYRNEDVVVDILKAVMFWMDEGVDGLRVDAVPHIFEDPNFGYELPNPNPPNGSVCAPEMFDYSCLIHDKTYNLDEVFPLLARFRSILDIYSSRDEHPRVMMVEATIPSLDELFEYYGNTERSGGKPIAHYPFNFEFINRIKPGFSGDDIENLISEWFTKMPAGQTANWLLGNHDNGRVASRFSPEIVDAFNMINLLLPGSAVTYYGEELGMTNADISWEDTVDPPACNAGPDRYHLFSRDPARTPMQWNGREKNAGFSTNDSTWLPMHHDWQTVNVEGQLSSTNLTHLQVYKKILKLRKSDIWRFGSFESKTLGSGELFGFARVHNGSGFAFLSNFGQGVKVVNISNTFPTSNVPVEANVYVTSVGYEPVYELDSPKRTDSVAIFPNHAIIINWGPVEIEPPTTSDPTEPTTTTTSPEAPTTTTEDTEPPTTPTEPPTSPQTVETTTQGASRNGFSLVIFILASVSIAFAHMS